MILVEGMLDLVFPRGCLACERFLGGSRFTYLCPACWRDLLVRPPGRGRMQGLACDAAATAGPYEGTMRRLIHAFKFSGRRSAALPLGRLMAQRRAVESDPRAPRFDLIVPVPLAPSKRRRRGFNQALLLAGQLGRLLGVEVSEALSRARDDGAQSLLPATRRAANVRGSFRVRGGSSVAGCRVLLVDDVITTGSTASECARSLKRSGALWVEAFAAAGTRDIFMF